LAPKYNSQSNALRRTLRGTIKPAAQLPRLQLCLGKRLAGGTYHGAKVVLWVKDVLPDVEIT
jgi:hypothetical protein